MPGPATRVLVADDDASLVQTLTWILKENGYEVAVCPGGEGLFAKLEEIKPALLLLDIMMPKVDGLPLLERLKQDERYRDLPVLMVSSMPPEEATVRALGLGAADFISKPFRVRELLARVEAHIRVGRALAQAREEARSRAAMVDILHEVTDSLKPDEIYHILARRVARALNISKCSMVLAKPGDQQGIVVAAYENPMLRNLQIELARYPEIRKAVSTGRLVLVEDVATDALYEDERRRSTAHAGRRAVRRDGHQDRGVGDREGVRFRNRSLRQAAAREAGVDRRADRLHEPAGARRGAGAGAGSRAALQSGADDSARGHRPFQIDQRHARPHRGRLGAAAGRRAAAARSAIGRHRGPLRRRGVRRGDARDGAAWRRDLRRTVTPSRHGP